MNYKRIMVAVDGSETSDSAFLEALNLTKLLQAELCIVTVVAPFPLRNVAIGADIDRCQVINRNDSQTILDHLKDIAQQKNINAEIKLIEMADTTTTISEKIIEVAETWHTDLIVIGTHGKQGFRRLVLGSVAEGTARRSSIPVMLVRAKENQ
ncbi:MAG: universal stress protein [Gammaproteobacteria bacterium]|nr:universal stress protein [Gammaproteobacteria bacterium]